MRKQFPLREKHRNRQENGHQAVNISERTE